MGDVLRDLKYSIRLMMKSPLFSIIAVGTLALGIGLNAATFSAVSGLLLRPLAGAHQPSELVQMYRQWPGMDFGSNSVPHFQDVRDRSKDVFENVAAWTFAPISMAAEGRNERIMAVVASASIFETYGVVPHLGRGFIPGVESEGPGEHAVAVIGYGFWESRFGADPGVVGRTIDVNGVPFEIVGVTSKAFKGPMSVMDVPIYFPLMMHRQISPGSNMLEQRGSNSLFGIARLRDGRSLEQAQQMMDAMLLGFKEEMPDQYDEQVGTTLVLQTEAGIHPIFRSAQMGLGTVVMVVVALLLLIACVNVANLFLARARERRHEMGIRMSLGGGRRRIIRQLLTESLLFSAVAGTLGVVLAYFVTGLIGRVKPPIDGPFQMNVEMDGRVLLFAVLVSVFAGLTFGLAPALQSSNPRLVSAVRGGGSGWGRSKLSSGLIVVQVALSLILLISSGLFLRSLRGALEIDPGFEDAKSLVIASVDPGLQGYDETRAREFFNRLQQEVGSIARVESVGLADALPLGMGMQDRSVEIPGYEFTEDELRSLAYAQIREGYLETMGTEVIAGRTFTAQDDEAGAPVVIINQRFADRFWPGESALGKVVTTAGEDRTVVGVVETGKYRSLGEAPQEYMYLPQREVFTSGMTLVVRALGRPDEVLSAVRGVVSDLDPDMPVYDVRSMEDHLGIALLPARMAGSVLGLFGILGLTLAAVGIYGVMAYSVAQRKKELGIRVALGAAQSGVVSMVLKEGLRLTAIGMVIGLVGAVASARLVSSLLYDVSTLDPVAFGVVPLILLAVATVAVYIPARGASRVDPIQVLRAD